LAGSHEGAAVLKFSGDDYRACCAPQAYAAKIVPLGQNKTPSRAGLRVNLKQRELEPRENSAVIKALR
jgi:hypothetical protein